MLNKKANVIIKVDFSTEQTVGEITKIVGLTKAKYLVPVIDLLDLEANPRSSKTGPVTDAIQESIETDPNVFPFKTKGILLAVSQYERLDRGRIKVTPDNPDIEGILDGGHNTLAIGLHILKKSMEYKGVSFPRGAKTWDEFKHLWQANRDMVDEYLDVLRKDPDIGDLSFYVPVELLVPRSAEELSSVEAFKNDLLEICAARNNNVQLQVSAKANQLGYFDTLKDLMDEHNPTLSNCLKQFEKLMSSPEVTAETTMDYKRELRNLEVGSAFKIAVELPELYDYIYEVFPDLYNAAGGSYGRITAVKKLNEKRKDKKTPFTEVEIETVSPEGFIVPLVYGLQALMENRIVNGRNEIHWTQPPKIFLQNNLKKIIAHYAGIFSMCDYDPQKIGKNPQSYAQALAGFKMALAGIL